MPKKIDVESIDFNLQDWLIANEGAKTETALVFCNCAEHVAEWVSAMHSNKQQRSISATQAESPKGKFGWLICEKIVDENNNSEESDEEITNKLVFEILADLLDEINKSKGIKDAKEN